MHLGDDARPLRVGLLLARPIAARFAPAHEELSLLEGQIEWPLRPGPSHGRCDTRIEVWDRVGVERGENGPEMLRSPVDVYVHDGYVTTEPVVLQYL